tara:strand:+ start:2283 stop:3005 length:723 start_codon:yes stop_codon:yes gene_type:complete
MKMNDNLVLISGKSATGKSASLMNIADPEGVIYLNCENNKKLPFRGKFTEFGITDPLQVYQAFEEAEKMDDVHTIVVDSLTYMMDMYESYYVLNSSNTMKAWGDYAQFFKKLMSKYVAESTKNVIFIAHTSDIMNDAEMAMETLVKVKGSLMNQGIESYFSTVVSTKKVNLKHLKKYESDLLEITPDEEELGFKYVFQTRITKDTVNERMRAPLSMWATKETFTDNNIQLVIDRLHEYYV